MRAALFAFPQRLATQVGLERFQFAQERLDGVVEGFDDIRGELFAAKNVRRQPQRERGSVKHFLGMPFKGDLEVNGVRPEMFQVLFKLRNFLAEFLPQQLVSVEIFGHEIPGQCGPFGHRQFKSRLWRCARRPGRRAGAGSSRASFPRRFRV